MKPTVGVIYSHSKDGSIESRNLAFHLTGRLLDTGFANVHLVGLTPDGAPCEYPPRQRIVYSKTASSKPIEVPTSDIVFSHWNVLPQCHVIIVTVNSVDTKICAEKLVSVMVDKNVKKIPIFSLQRGVKSGSAFKDEVDGKNGLIVVEGVTGFGVVTNPKTLALVPTVDHPVIMFERVSKEIENVVVGPLNLIERMGLEVYYRKILTPYCWGVIIYESLFFLNALHGESLQKTILDPSYRLALALMTRECRQTLHLAAKGGAWTPNMMMISTMLSIWQWEMLLMMPWPVFNILAGLLKVLPPSNIISPCQEDFSEKRTSSAQWVLGELLDVGKRFNFPMPVCSTVYAKVLALEKAGKSTEYNQEGFNDIGAVIDNIKKTNNNVLPASKELFYFLVRVVLGVAVILFVLYVIIVEDW